MTASALLSEASALADTLRDVRRTLHRRPELGLHTPETLEVVLSAIADLDLEVTRSASITSAVVRIPGSSPGPTVVLRADLDALALAEKSGLEFASEIPGRMHACGHDLHAAAAVGAIRLLHSRRDEFAGEVLFFLQPGEEGENGANRMLEEGALDLASGAVVGAFAIHVISTMPLGLVSTKPGTVMSGSGDLHVTVLGEGGHGSAPHLAKDPTQCAAEIVTALQTMVTRRFSAFDPVIVSLGWIAAGVPGTVNVIPDTAEFGATVRTFSSESSERFSQLAAELAVGIANAHGLHANVTYTALTDPLVNSDEHAALAEGVARSLFGDGRYEELAAPLGASEDFAAVLERVPGAFVFLGACPPDLDPTTAAYNHSPLVRFDDTVLVDAAAYLAGLALTQLGASRT